MTAQMVEMGMAGQKRAEMARGKGKFCTAAALAALLVVLTALSEIAITFLPGGYASAGNIREWFALLQANPFLGLRNLGLLNIIMTTLGIPMLLALFMLHRKANPSLAGLAIVISLIGTAVFYATNRSFPMLDLALRYGAASPSERSALEAAGLAMLSVGQSHTPGTFLAFFLSEIGGILMGVVMLRAKVFPPVAAGAGALGYSLLLVYEILATFVPSTGGAALIPAMLGGLLNITWYALVARGLFQLGRS